MSPTPRDFSLVHYAGKFSIWQVTVADPIEVISQPEYFMNCKRILDVGNWIIVTAVPKDAPQFHGVLVVAAKSPLRIETWHMAGAGGFPARLLDTINSEAA